MGKKIYKKLKDTIKGNPLLITINTVLKISKKIRKIVNKQQTFLLNLSIIIPLKKVKFQLINYII